MNIKHEKHDTNCASNIHNNKNNSNNNINNSNNNINNNNNKSKRDIVFKVRADIQNDIYHLFSIDSTNGEDVYHNVAYIPDYKTSIFMNRLFRKIKENENLDSLEESDNEEEFENNREDKHVFLEREYHMICNYHHKFKKWVPVRISEFVYSK